MRNYQNNHIFFGVTSGINAEAYTPLKSTCVGALRWVRPPMRAIHVADTLPVSEITLFNSIRIRGRSLGKST